MSLRTIVLASYFECQALEDYIELGVTLQPPGLRHARFTSLKLRFKWEGPTRADIDFYLNRPTRFRQDDGWKLSGGITSMRQDVSKLNRGLLSFVSHLVIYFIFCLLIFYHLVR